MGAPHTPLSGLASAGSSVMRCGLVTAFVWIGALKFTDYEVENAEPLVTPSPLTSRLRAKLGAQKLARLVGVTQITLGSLIAAKPVAPRSRRLAASRPRGCCSARSASWSPRRKRGRRGRAGYRSCLCWVRAC
jgi:reactive chlorine resistance protein C